VLSVLLMQACLSLRAAEPVWGATRSSPVETAPAQLKPGEWISTGPVTGPGPLAR
jgi:hypothetical protein